MIPRWLGLLLVLGCASGRAPEPSPRQAADTASAVEDQQVVCARAGNVTVHVDNRSSFSIEISFGSYTPARAALGLSWTTYSVPRYYLEGNILLRIVGGGLELSASPSIPTEPVACNDATLLIGPRPRYSFFYGDLVQMPHEPDVPDSVRARALQPAS